MWAVIGSRFAAPLLLFRFPLPAILVCLVIDGVDQTVLELMLDEPMAGYQSYDKALDIFYLTLAYFSTMRNWRYEYAFRWARALFYYRLIGVSLFELLDHRWLLVVFANVFEFWFIAFEVVRTRWDPRRMSRRAVVWIVVAIWVGIKLPQEWWVHGAQLDLTDELGKRPALGWLIVGMVVLAAAAVWLLRTRLPVRDWPTTFDVDRLQAPPTKAARRGDGFMSAVLVEKLVLLVLICEIFANVLPDVEARNLGLFVGALALAMINAVLSQVMRRFGHVWSSIAQEFVAVLAVNTAFAAADALIGRRRIADLPAWSTMFYVVLLALLISLYDRYRSRRFVDRSTGPRWQPRAAGLRRLRVEGPPRLGGATTAP